MAIIKTEVDKPKKKNLPVIKGKEKKYQIINTQIKADYFNN